MSSSKAGRIGHIQICAGKDKSGTYLWYNAGGRDSIQATKPEYKSPYPRDVSGRFLFGLRQN